MTQVAAAMGADRPHYILRIIYITLCGYENGLGADRLHDVAQTIYIWLEPV